MMENPPQQSGTSHYPIWPFDAGAVLEAIRAGTFGPASSFIPPTRGEENGVTCVLFPIRDRYCRHLINSTGAVLQPGEGWPGCPTMVTVGCGLFGLAGVDAAPPGAACCRNCTAYSPLPPSAASVLPGGGGGGSGGR